MPDDFTPSLPAEVNQLHPEPTDDSPPSSPYLPSGSQPRDPEAYPPFSNLPLSTSVQFTHKLSNYKSNDKPSNNLDKSVSNDKPANDTGKEQSEPVNAIQAACEADREAEREKRIQKILARKRTDIRSLKHWEVDELPYEEQKDYWERAWGAKPETDEKPPEKYEIREKKQPEHPTVLDERAPIVRKHKPNYFSAQRLLSQQQAKPRPTHFVNEAGNLQEHSTGSPHGRDHYDVPETREGQFYKERKTPSLLNNKFAESSASRRGAPRPLEQINPTAMFHIKTPAANSPAKIAIIGGTGLDQDSSLFKEKRMVDLPETPYGEPSDKQVVEGKIGNTVVVLLARHGKDHNVSPSNVNYRANIWALKQIGCHIVLATTACGSLKLDIPPGHLVVLDQYIDR